MPRCVKWRQTPVTVSAKDLERPPVVKPGKGSGTTNRELRILNKALRLAARHEKLAWVPIIELLADSKARKRASPRSCPELGGGPASSSFRTSSLPCNLGLSRPEGTETVTPARLQLRRRQRHSDADTLSLADEVE